MSENKKSISHTRNVKGYLSPSNYSFFSKYVNNNAISKSTGINEAVAALKILKTKHSK